MRFLPAVPTIPSLSWPPLLLAQKVMGNAISYLVMTKTVLLSTLGFVSEAWNLISRWGLNHCILCLMEHACSGHERSSLAPCSQASDDACCNIRQPRSYGCLRSSQRLINHCCPAGTEGTSRTADRTTKTNARLPLFKCESVLLKQIKALICYA